MKAKKGHALWTTKEAAARPWADKGKVPVVRLPNGYRRYDLSELVEDAAPPGKQNDAAHDTTEPDARVDVVYCRVSTPNQRAYLDNQGASASARLAKAPRGA